MSAAFFCYGVEETACIYAMHLTTADQSEIRRAYLVSVYNSQNKAANTSKKDENAENVCRTNRKDVARTYKILYYVK